MKLLNGILSFIASLNCLRHCQVAPHEIHYGNRISRKMLHAKRNRCSRWFVCFKLKTVYHVDEASVAMIFGQVFWVGFFIRCLITNSKHDAFTKSDQTKEKAEREPIHLNIYHFCTLLMHLCGMTFIIDALSKDKLIGVRQSRIRNSWMQFTDGKGSLVFVISGNH